MGLLQTFGLRPKANVVEAQYAPAIMDGGYGIGPYSYNTGYGAGYGAGVMDRLTALQVASVSRCRNLICGVISSIDLELYNKKSGAELESPLWLEQPDIRQPRSVTISYTVDALLFYGTAYWRVTSLYADDGRPSGFEFIPNNRVTATTDKFGMNIEYYTVNGEPVPMSGIGSLVTFQSLLPGVLSTGARTIQAALDIQKAAAIAAATPMATGFLKNNGADLPEAQVQGLLASWKASRNARSTAFLTSTLEYIPTSYSPKEMTYNESIQNYALQIARMMNVPASMIDAEIFRSNTYQNILDGRKEFMAYTLQPYISVIEDRLSMDDLTARTSEVKFAVDETFLRVDAKSRLDILEQMLTLGLITTDQAMAMEQLTPSGDGEATSEINIQ